jgi:hypothetical protein
MTLMASGVTFAVLTKLRPIWAIGRGAIMARAAGYLLVQMAEGAWARRTRWAECEERARREA